VLRISEPNKEEVTRGWRNLHNDELHNLYSSPNIIRAVTLRMRLAEHMWEMRTAYRKTVSEEATFGH
jgi:hypothetical protein